MGLKRIAVALVAAVVVLAVAGCTTGSPNTAAVVNGKVITESSIQTAAQASWEILSLDPSYKDWNQGAVGFVLHYNIMSLLLTDALASLGVEISEDERDASWEYNFGGVNENGQRFAGYGLWEDPRTKDAFRGYIDYDLVGELLQSGQFTEDQLVSAMRSVEVTLNPRYGTWNEEAMAMSSNMIGIPDGVMAEAIPFPLPA